MGIVIRRLCRERYVGLLSDSVTYLNFTASNIMLFSRGRLERTCEDTFIYHYNALPRNIPEATGKFHGKKKGGGGRQTPGKEWKSGNQKHKAAAITNLP